MLQARSRVHAVVEALPALVNDDAGLVRRGRFLEAEILFAAGDEDFHLSIRGGRIERLLAGPLLMKPWSFAIRGTAEAWLEHWRPLPQPGFHDLFALTKRGLARIEGDLRPLMQNLQYVKDLLAAPRRLEAGR